MTLDWRRVQTALARAGGRPGAIDGVRGVRTLRALLDFAAGRSLGSAGDCRATVALDHYDGAGLTTPARLAEFLAQTTHETGGFRCNVENLTYRSAARIVATWPARFANVTAAERFVGDPVALANLVYDRPAEGNVEPGDGWRYRGRGDLQLTFRGNYARMGAALGLDLLADPDRAAEPDVAHRIALEFWRRAGVNAWIDRGDFRAARGLTNMGTAHPAAEPIGLANVARRRTRLLRLLA